MLAEGYVPLAQATEAEAAIHEAAARAAFERESERVWGAMEAQVWEIFEMFDTKREGRLDKAAYQRYLRGIGSWGTHHYTDEGWDEGWLKDCELFGCTADTGVTREGFKALYIKYRTTDAAADLASCHATLVSALRPTPPRTSLPACASSRHSLLTGR